MPPTKFYSKIIAQSTLDIRNLGQIVLFLVFLEQFVLKIPSTLILVYNIIGDKMRLRIRDIREDADLTQHQIASYINCSQSLYSKYEREERDIPLDIIIKLSIYYGTSVDYLLGLTDQKEPPKRKK